MQSHDLLDRPDSKRASMVETSLQPSITIEYKTPKGVEYPMVEGSSKTSSSCDEKQASRSASSSEIEEIKGCVNATFDLLHIYGMNNDASVKRAKIRTIQHWSDYALRLGPDGWMKYVKWKFAAFFHSHTQQRDSAPAAPAGCETDNPKHLCSGVAGRYALRLVRSEQRMSFLTSVSQIKKGCPRPSPQMVEAQVAKTRIALTTVPTNASNATSSKRLLEWGDYEHDGMMFCGHSKSDIFARPDHLSRQECLFQLRRTVREIFQGRMYTDKYRYNPSLPSTSATFEDPRGVGGQVNSLRALSESLQLNTYLTDYQLSCGSEVKERKGDGKHSSGCICKECLFNRVPEEHRIHTLLHGLDGPSKIRFKERHQEESRLQDEKVWKADVSEIQSSYNKLYDAAFDTAILEPPNVKPVGLAEPLKVRVITKGPPFTQFVLKPLQRFLWESLVEHKSNVFSLIGRPVDHQYVQTRLGAKLALDEFYLSGDYSAATDNLAPWVSECIADEISKICGLREEERDMFIRILTKHIFVDDEKHALPQQWGQLMGSVISFPVLCIANAAICRWALELAYQRDMLLEQTTLFINGDDVAFKCNLLGLRLWKEMTTFIGLTPSIGKFFASAEFVQINSENFVRLETPVYEGSMYDRLGKRRTVRDSNPRPFYFSTTKYVNLGLLYGLKRSGKVGMSDVSSDTNGLGVRCRELLSKCPPSLCESLMKKFIDHHRETLNKVSIPWFIPEEWGGVGLPRICSISGEEVDELKATQIYGPSELDLRICARIKEQPAKYPVRKPTPDIPWNIHKFVQSRYPQKPHSINHASDDQIKSFDRLYKWMVVDSFFSCKELMNDGQNYVNTLRHNERIWRNVRLAGSLPPPLRYSTVCSNSPEGALLLVDFAPIVGRDYRLNVRDYDWGLFGLGNLRFHEYPSNPNFNLDERIAEFEMFNIQHEPNLRQFGKMERDAYHMFRLLID